MPNYPASATESDDESQQLLLEGQGSAAEPAEVLSRRVLIAIVAVVLMAAVSIFGHSRQAHLSGSRLRDFLEGVEVRQVQIVESAKGGGLLEEKPAAYMTADFDFDGPTIELSTTETDQELIGFGGAFTEASAMLFHKLDLVLQERILEAYFGESGIGFSLGRVHINSCDFARESYSFDDVEDDFSLEHFNMSVERDTEALIPLIKRAKRMVEQRGDSLLLLATPWSPPAWMKTNRQMDSTGTPCLRPDAHQAWAEYISKWISAYQAQAVPIWAITVQNEPGVRSGWEACALSPDEEAAFLFNHLGPSLKAEHPEVLIFVHDDGKESIERYASATFALDEKYITGIAFHWYDGDHYDDVANAHKKYPRAPLLASEATYEKYRWPTQTERVVPHWSFGEGYAHDIIGDLNAGAAGWMDWNLLLDTTGGPNHVGNMCAAAIVVDVDMQQMELHPQYYYLAHFSKFIWPGSLRLVSEVNNSQTYEGSPRPYGTCTIEDGLQATAFRRKDGQLVVVALNCGDDALEFKVRLDGGRSAMRGLLPPHGIQTLILTL